MMSREERLVSKSRTYVAICNNISFDGHYFRKFRLPEREVNTAEHATWYFLNRLDFCACIDGVVTWEDFQRIDEVPANRYPHCDAA